MLHAQVPRRQGLASAMAWRGGDYCGFRRRLVPITGEAPRFRVIIRLRLLAPIVTLPCSRQCALTSRRLTAIFRATDASFSFAIFAMSGRGYRPASRRRHDSEVAASRSRQRHRYRPRRRCGRRRGVGPIDHYRHMISAYFRRGHVRSAARQAAPRSRPCPTPALFGASPRRALPSPVRRRLLELSVIDCTARLHARADEVPREARRRSRPPRPRDETGRGGLSSDVALILAIRDGWTPALS